MTFSQTFSILALGFLLVAMGLLIYRAIRQRSWEPVLVPGFIGAALLWALFGAAALAQTRPDGLNVAEFAPGKTVNLDIPLTDSEVNRCQEVERAFRNALTDDSLWADAQRAHGKERIWCAWLFRVYRSAGAADLPIADILKALTKR